MKDSLHLVGTRDGLVITDCRAKLEQFIEFEAFRGYDCVGYRYLADPDQLQRPLLTAMNTAMMARSRLDAWEPFLGRTLPELAAVPQDVDLVESPADQYEQACAALDSCYRLLAGGPHITDMAASKMLYLKRPRLVAISDTYVRRALGMQEPPASLQRQEYYAARALAVADAVREVGRANLDVLEGLNAAVVPIVQKVGGESAFLTSARIIDVLMWADMAISRCGGVWYRLARMAGWRSIAWDLCGKGAQ